MDEASLGVARTWTGQWWRPDDPENKMPGVLSYDPDSGMRLDLIGGWDNHVSFPGTNGGMVVTNNTRDWPIIHGIGDGKKITLLDTFGTSAQTFDLGRSPFGVPDKQKIVVNNVLVGCHLADGDEQAFLAAAVAAEYLTHWSKRTGVHAQMHPNPGDDNLGKIEVERVDPQEVAVGTVTAKLHTVQWLPYFEQHRGYQFARAREHATVEFISEEPQSMREWLTFTSGVRDLLSFATQKACAFISIRLYMPPTPEAYPKGHPMQHMKREVQLYQQHFTVPDADSEIDLRDFLFTLDDVPFDVVMPRWTELRETFRGALGMILSQFYAEGGFLETQVVATVAAAESFHRSLGTAKPLTNAQHRSLLRTLRRATPDALKTFVSDRLPRNEPTLRERLLEMVERAGEPGKRLIPDPETWAAAAKDARNKLAHTGATDVHGNDVLHALVRVTSALVVVNLLLELGLPEDSVTQMVERHRTLSWASSLSREHFTAAPDADDA